jgi:O-antigen ligase
LEDKKKESNIKFVSAVILSNIVLIGGLLLLLSNFIMQSTTQTVFILIYLLMFFIIIIQIFGLLASFKRNNWININLKSKYFIISSFIIALACLIETVNHLNFTWLLFLISLFQLLVSSSIGGFKNLSGVKTEEQGDKK